MKIMPSEERKFYLFSSHILIVVDLFYFIFVVSYLIIMNILCIHLNSEYNQ